MTPTRNFEDLKDIFPERVIEKMQFKMNFRNFPKDRLDRSGDACADFLGTAESMMQICAIAAATERFGDKSPISHCVRVDGFWKTAAEVQNRQRLPFSSAQIGVFVPGYTHASTRC